MYIPGASEKLTCARLQRVLSNESVFVLVFEMSEFHRSSLMGLLEKMYWLHLDTSVLTIPGPLSVKYVVRINKFIYFRGSQKQVHRHFVAHSTDIDPLQHNASGSQHASLTTSCYLQLQKSNDPSRPRSRHHRALDMHRPALAVNGPLDGLPPAYHPRRTLHEGPGLDNLGLILGGLGVGGR
ncbi:hypothetical protein VC83_07248 [Pseudogymnoascus destructans]|uniref:Uncharacterized protein n=1 Tax=Pseudogymnoascus destructans TaxID=655981 RepID=A0A177A3D6_9PEZI|nr:uncharacterized protein VC83_07248 [Pseudogymnoascus destructans]OAF56617.1 hypothetical protein VC83_07248 [Pseudogymnoascus destructans]